MRISHIVVRLRVRSATGLLVLLLLVGMLLILMEGWGGMLVMLRSINSTLYSIILINHKEILFQVQLIQMEYLWDIVSKRPSTAP